MTSERKPTPHGDRYATIYWDATSRGELHIQHCSKCDQLRHYPTALCPHCHSFEHDWIVASGRGKLHSWTVCHHAFHPGFKNALPYTLVTVDLVEGVRTLGLLEEGTAHELTIGMPLQASFKKREDGFGDLVFQISGV